MAENTAKTLVLLRHADARSRRAGEEDRERPLSAVGHAQSSALAKKLSALDYRPDKVLISDALRARETWRELAQRMAFSIEPVVDHALYLAPPGELLALLQDIGAKSESVLVIGHNPGLTILAQALVDEAADPAAIKHLSRGLSPSGFALFEPAIGNWSDLSPRRNKLVLCDSP